MESTENEGEELVFACPSCGSSLLVNPPMRDTLLENGCVLCGTTVGADDFATAE